MVQNTTTQKDQIRYDHSGMVRRLVFGDIVQSAMIRSVERIWARATGHVMGDTDQDRPRVPILTVKEARVALCLKTFWIVIHVITCGFIIANVIRHW